LLADALAQHKQSYEEWRRQATKAKNLGLDDVSRSGRYGKLQQIEKRQHFQTFFEASDELMDTMNELDQQVNKTVDEQRILDYIRTQEQADTLYSSKAELQDLVKYILGLVFKVPDLHNRAKELVKHIPQEALNEHKQRITTLFNQSNSNAQNFKIWLGDLAELMAKITKLTADASDAETKYEQELQKKTEYIETLEQANEEQKGATDQLIMAHQAEVAELMAKLRAKAGTPAPSAQDQDFANQITALNAKVAELTGNLTAANTPIGNLRANIRGRDTEIQRLKETRIDHRLRATRDDAGNRLDDWDTIYACVIKRSQRIDQLERDLTKSQDKVKDLNQQLKNWADEPLTIVQGPSESERSAQTFVADQVEEIRRVLIQFGRHARGKKNGVISLTTFDVPDTASTFFADLRTYVEAFAKLESPPDSVNPNNPRLFEKFRSAIDENFTQLAIDMAAYIKNVCIQLKKLKEEKTNYHKSLQEKQQTCDAEKKEVQDCADKMVEEEQRVCGEEKDRLQKKIERLEDEKKKEAEKLRNEVKEARNKLIEVQKKEQDLDTQLTACKQEGEGLRQEKRTNGSKITSLEQEINELKQERQSSIDVQTQMTRLESELRDIRPKAIEVERLRTEISQQAEQCKTDKKELEAKITTAEAETEKKSQELAAKTDEMVREVDKKWAAEEMVGQLTETVNRWKTMSLTHLSTHPDWTRYARAFGDLKSEFEVAAAIAKLPLNLEATRTNLMESMQLRDFAHVRQEPIDVFIQIWRVLLHPNHQLDRLAPYDLIFNLRRCEDYNLHLGLALLETGLVTMAGMTNPGPNEWTADCCFAWLKLVDILCTFYNGHHDRLAPIAAVMETMRMGTGIRSKLVNAMFEAVSSKLKGSPKFLTRILEEKAHADDDLFEVGDYKLVPDGGRIIYFQGGHASDSIIVLHEFALECTTFGWDLFINNLHEGYAWKLNIEAARDYEMRGRVQRNFAAALKTLADTKNVDFQSLPLYGDKGGQDDGSDTDAYDDYDYSDWNQ
jgi:hypothetical protein